MEKTGIYCKQLKSRERPFGDKVYRRCGMVQAGRRKYTNVHEKRQESDRHQKVQETRRASLRIKIQRRGIETYEQSES